MSKSNKRQIAPRLRSGDHRWRNAHALPPEIWEGIREIARLERRSMSWVLEQCIVEFFHLRQPKYREPKAAPAKKIKTKAA